MEPLLLLVCAVMAAVLVVAGLQAMRGDRRPALVAVPLGVGLVVALVLAGRWPPTAWLLVVAVLVGPAVLAYRVRTPTAWNAVLVFALAGAVAGYGLLDWLLARADGGPTASGAVMAATAGIVVGAAAYAWLYVQALVRR